MINKYTGIYTDIADYYDLLVKAGNYDHQALANVAHLIIGESRKILEIGVGTGLLAKKLLDIQPKYEYTGVDISPPMLDIAKGRLGERAKLIEGDFLDTEFADTFDVVISSAGVWTILEREDEYDLGSYILDLKKNIAGLQKVAKCLHSNGYLLLSGQASSCLGMQKKRETNIGDDITYSYEIEEIEQNSDYYSTEKRYFFKQGNKTLSEEKIRFKFF